MNKHILPDGRTFRVVGSNILVERIPLARTYKDSSIIINREKEDATAVGIVRAVGNLWSKKSEKYVPIDGIYPGLKVAFLWFYAERHTNLQLQQRIGENLVILKWQDISLVWDPELFDHEISDIVSNGA